MRAFGTAQAGHLSCYIRFFETSGTMVSAIDKKEPGLVGPGSPDEPIMQSCTGVGYCDAFTSSRICDSSAR
jgi:hypothetical protein